MNTNDIKRLALILAVQAERDGMKAECVFRAGLKDCKKQIINKLK